MNKRSLLSAFLIAMIAGGLALTGTVHFTKAQNSTNVIGIISSDVTMAKANSPYVFTGPVVVNANATLTIQAGVTLNLGGNYLQVSGTLIAKGSSVEPIYFNDGSINFTSTSTTDCIIENAILNWILVSISSSVKINSTYIQGAQGQNVINIYGGSPIISNNTLTGNVDSIAIVDISGGSPTISNNNIIAHVDNGLYPNPPSGMNRFGTEYGIYATNVNGAYITDNRLILPFVNAGIQVASGTATVEGNSELSYNPISTPTPSPTPTPSSTPTLSPYTSTSGSPTPSQTTTTSSPATPQTGPNGTEIAIIIALIVIASIQALTLALVLKKKR